MLAAVSSWAFKPLPEPEPPAEWRAEWYTRWASSVGWAYLLTTDAPFRFEAPWQPSPSPEEETEFLVYEPAPPPSSPELDWNEEQDLLPSPYYDYEELDWHEEQDHATWEGWGDDVRYYYEALAARWGAAALQHDYIDRNPTSYFYKYSFPLPSPE